MKLRLVEELERSPGTPSKTHVPHIKVTHEFPPTGSAQTAYSVRYRLGVLFEAQYVSGEHDQHLSAYKVDNAKREILDAVYGQLSTPLALAEYALNDGDIDAARTQIQRLQKLIQGFDA